MCQSTKRLPTVLKILWRIPVFFILILSVLLLTACWPKWSCLLATGLTALLLGIGLFIPGNPLAKLLWRKKPLRIFCGALLALVSGGCVLLFIFLYTAMPRALYRPADNGYLRTDFMNDQRALVFVPHQDDDVNTAGAVMEALRQNGASVDLAFLTNGDGLDLGALRLGEALDCAEAMGIDPSHVHFLGYGDQWQGAHLYNSPDRQPLLSRIGYGETYGLPHHPDFSTRYNGEPHQYTRENCMRDICDLIRRVEPDVIYCTDYDAHPDHRATSLLFEEAMGLLLQDPDFRRPVVFKSISYLTGWFAPKDFYAIPMKMTQCPDAGEYPLGTPSYRWEERVRFPVPPEFLSYTLRANEVRRLHRFYASQNAVLRSPSVANSDEIFFERRTDSLLYGQTLTAASGDPSVLTDFKLYDTSDILEFRLDEGVWCPEEGEKTVRCLFDSPQSLNTVTLWDNSSPEDNVLSARLTLSDGSVIPVGPPDRMGASCTVSFPQRDNILWAELTILESEGARAGFTEWELSLREERPTEFIKLCSHDGNFIYEAPAPLKEAFSLEVYAWPALPPEASFTLRAEGPRGELLEYSGLSAEELQLTLPQRGLWTVRVIWEQKPSLYDQCLLRAGGPRLWDRMVQGFEPRLDRVVGKASECLQHLGL